MLIGGSSAGTRSVGAEVSREMGIGQVVKTAKYATRHQSAACSWTPYGRTDRKLLIKVCNRRMYSYSAAETVKGWRIGTVDDDVRGEVRGDGKILYVRS